MLQNIWLLPVFGNCVWPITMYLKMDGRPMVQSIKILRRSFFYSKSIISSKLYQYNFRNPSAAPHDKRKTSNIIKIYFNSLLVFYNYDMAIVKFFYGGAKIALIIISSIYLRTNFEEEFYN